MCIVVVRLWVLLLDRGFDVARLWRLWRRVCLCRLGDRGETAAWGEQPCRCRHFCSNVMLWMRVFRRRRRPSSSSFEGKAYESTI